MASASETVRISPNDTIPLADRAPSRTTDCQASAFALMADQRRSGNTPELIASGPWQTRQL